MDQYNPDNFLIKIQENYWH